MNVDAIKSVLDAFLPQLALIIFSTLLLKILSFLSKAEGILLESHVVRAASGKYFYFSVWCFHWSVTQCNILPDLCGFGVRLRSWFWNSYIFFFLFLFYFVTPLHPINYVVNEKPVLLFMVCSDDIFHDSSLKGGRAPSHDIEYKWNYFIFFVHYTLCIKI